MIELLKSLKDKDTQDKMLKKWCSEKDPEKRKEIMKQAKKQAKKLADKATAGGAGGGRDGDPPLPSMAHMQNPATVGRQGTTPETVNPADFKGANLDIFQPEPSENTGPEIVVDDSGEYLTALI